MKKTIIAIAAATSVALTQGVAMADEPVDDPAIVADQKVEDKPTEDEGNLGSDATSSLDEKEGEGALSSSGNDKKNDDTEAKAFGSSEFFGWNDETDAFKKFKDVSALIAGVVALLGSVSALIANMEKIVNQITGAFNK